MAIGIGNFIDRLQLGSNEAEQIAIGSSAYGICTTAANEQNKTINIPGFVLQNHHGTTLHIRFQNNNTASAPTLNVSNTGALPIISYDGATAGTDDDTTGWHAGAVLSLTYDANVGQNGVWIRHSSANTNTTYASLAAEANGSAVSLVTTGEKYTWNNKSNITSLTLGAGIYGTTLISAGEIKVDLRDYTPLLDSPTSNNSILPVVLDSDSHLAIQLPSSSGVVTNLIAGLSNSITNAINNNNDLYIRLFNNGTFNSELQLIGGNNVFISSDANGVITFTAVDTTYNVFTASTNGLVPFPGDQGDGTRFLNESGQWFTPVLSLATSTSIGGIKIGFTTLEPKKYAVELDSNGMAYVSVPWDTNTDTMVTQTETNDNNVYEILFSNSTYLSNSTLTETARKSNNLVFNPSSGVVTFLDPTNQVQASIGPVTYTGTAANVTGTVTVEHGGTGVTSVSAIKALLNYTAADLGLANALHFIGKATVTITDGSNTDPVITNYDFTNNKQYGDIIIDSTNAREYIWTYENKWEILGNDITSYKILQTPIAKPAEVTNQWVSAIGQDENGNLDISYASLDTSGTWTGNANTATSLGTSVNVGDNYTPVYFANGIPVQCTPLLQVPFTIKNGMKGISLSHAAFTSNSYVINIVIVSGESNLNAPLGWDSNTTGIIKLQCTAATSGEVSGYILVSRGDTLNTGITGTDIT